MKQITVIATIGLAALASAPAHGQQVRHLSAAYLARATPLLHWPRGLEPTNVDVFVHNEVWIKAPAAVVWANLIDATQWPHWYANAVNVQIDGAAKLAAGTRFHWTTYGFPIACHVDTFVPGREIGWSVDNPNFKVHHGWVLLSQHGGTLVITEEAQKGPDAIRFRLEQPNAMYDGHDWWLSALKARSERAGRL
jgi:uncharacterized protein YndB with AHSA1/START domain